MSTQKVLVFVICAVVLLVLLKSLKSDVGRIAAVFCVATVFVFSLSKLEPAIDFIKTLVENSGVSEEYFQIIIKTIGICILGDFASGICSDCGENSLAKSTEFFCKCSIISISIPLYSEVFNMIISLWQDT